MHFQNINNDCMGGMFNNCGRLSSIYIDFTTLPTEQWHSGIASFGIFSCASALGTDRTIARSDSKCPLNWVVANYDVDGYDMDNACTRGSYTTAFLEDGSSHVPDLAALSVFNGQTAEVLQYMS